MFAFFGEKLKVLLKFFFWFLRSRILLIYICSKEKLTTLGMWLVLIILYIFMDMVKFGDKKFMCIKSEKEHPIKQSTIA